MSKGKATVNYLGRSGVVMPQTVPSWDFIYEVSIIKHSKYEIGDRVVLPDGREYRYGLSAGACLPDQGCEFVAVGAIGSSYPTTTVAAGGKQVTLADSGSTTVLTNGHAAAFAKDVFRGGYVVFHAAGAAKVQFRGIIGNDYSVALAPLTIYLDGKLHQAIIGTSFAEVFENPYAALQTGTINSLTIAGVPAVEVSAASMYFWVQVRGPVFVSPVLAEMINNELGACWRHDGSVGGMNTMITNDISGVEVHTSQYAGYMLLGDAGNIGPLFMLQG